MRYALRCVYMARCTIMSPWTGRSSSDVAGCALLDFAGVGGVAATSVRDTCVRDTGAPVSGVAATSVRDTGAPVGAGFTVRGRFAGLPLCAYGPFCPPQSLH